MSNTMSLRVIMRLSAVALLWLSVVGHVRAQQGGDDDGDQLEIHGPSTVYDGFPPPDAQSNPPYIYSATGGSGDYQFSVDDSSIASIDPDTGELDVYGSGEVDVTVKDLTTDETAEMDVQAVLPPPCDQHLFIGTDESTGPRYRKVALNGLPMPDEKPQAQDETDQEKEETYVDSFSLLLRHSTTDVFVPLVGGELSLSVRRNLESETWNDRYGIWAENRVDEPFGVGWSTGLTPHVQFVTQTVPPNDSDCPAGQPPANYAYVTDENGTSHRFLMGSLPSGNTIQLVFFPLPTGRNEEDSFLDTLQVTPGSGTTPTGFPTSFTFKRKFGTTLVFQLVTTLESITYADNEHTSSGAYVTYDYARAISVTDRYQNSLQYTYTNGNSTLIPDSIASASVAQANPVYDGRSISITRTTDNKHIDSLTDPNGTTIKYQYSTSNVPAGQNPAAHVVPVLTQVTRAYGKNEASSTIYSYTPAYEVDGSPVASGDSSFYDYQINLQGIQDGRTNTYQFQYRVDHSRYNYDSRVGYYVVTGLPMNVVNVIPPIGPATTFTNNSKVYIGYTTPTTSQPTAMPVMKGLRESQIQDAEGHLRTYDFTNGQIISLSEFQDAISHTHDPRQNPLMIVYGTMTVTVPGGKESFQFDLNAGMALTQTTDFSGNSTTFTHTDTWNPLSTPPYNQLYSWMQPNPPFPIGLYTDPNSQLNAKGDTKYFRYDPTWRVMDRVLDEEGRLTIYTINPANSLRTAEDIYPAGAVAPGQITATPSGSPVQHTDFAYTNATFPAFMTSKTVRTLSGDPAWAKDLVVQYTPDAQGHVLTETTDPNTLKLTTTYSYDNNGNKKSARNPRLYTTSFKYDGLNRLYETDYPPDANYAGVAVKKTYGYDGNSNKISETDENGHSTLFVYDALNRLTDTGRDMNGDGKLTRNDNGGDLITSTGYNWVNSKTSLTDPNGNVTTMGYDALQRLSTKTAPAPLNYLTQYFYTGVNPGGNCFDSSSFKPTSIVDVARGYTTAVTYDALYRETARSVEYDLSSGATSTTQTGYDKVGNPTQITDPLLNVTLKTYDALNRLTGTTYANKTADQASESTAYTSTGLAWQFTDGNTKTTTKQYDTAGRVVLVTQPSVQMLDDGATAITQGQPAIQTIYDANGNVAATINPRNYRWDYGYDERDRRTTETDPTVVDAADGKSKRPVKTTGYDLAGNATTLTEARDANQPGAYTTTTAYDWANRPYQVTSPAVPVMLPNGTPTTRQPVASKVYDLSGDVVQTTDADVNQINNTYDHLNRLSTTADSQNCFVAYTYDAAGNRTSVNQGTTPSAGGKLPNDRLVTFGYDGLNRNTFFNDNSSYAAQATGGHHVTDFTYNALNKTGRLDLLGQQTTYGYDHRNRLQSVTYSNRAVDNRTYSHDGDGNILSVSEPNKNGAADVGYTYDAIDRVSTETSGGNTHDYYYDAAGNRTQAQYSVNLSPAGQVLTSSYDALNRLSTLVESTRTTGYSYDLDGNTLLKTLPDGEQLQTSYDALNRAAAITGAQGGGATLYSYAYAYDAAGNVRRSIEHYTSLPAQTITMGYDTANRLIEEDTAVSGGATTQISYGYDTSNNRTSRTVASGVAATYVFNNLNQLTSWSDTAHGGATYTYDANGNRSTLTPAASGQVASGYGYDFDNRLVSVTQGTSSYAYTYDYRTRRVTRTEPSVNTQVVYSGGTSVAEYALNATGQPAARATLEYVRGSDWGGGVGGILYTLQSAQVAAPVAANNATVKPRPPAWTPTYDHYNRRGDVVEQTNGSGVVSYEAAYEAWGTRPAEAGTDTQRQRANTKEEDPTGLLDEGMRYRDLAAGCFLTRDPAGMIDGPNLYAYVRQNPWTSFDPEGLSVIGDYVYGTALGWVEANSPVPLPHPAHPSRAMNSGLASGHILGAGQAAAEIITGGGMAVGGTVGEGAGVAATATGVGAPVGIPTVLASAAVQAGGVVLVGHGALVGVHSLSMLGQDVNAAVHGDGSNAGGDPGGGSAEKTQSKAKGSANEETKKAASRGSSLHSDKPGNLPDQLRERYPDTDFEFKPPGKPGQDVEVSGGTHPSEYPDSGWHPDADHGDFKPNTKGGDKTFKRDQATKWPEKTQKIPYDPPTGKLD